MVLTFRTPCCFVSFICVVVCIALELEMTQWCQSTPLLDAAATYFQGVPHWSETMAFQSWHALACFLLLLVACMGAHIEQLGIKSREDCEEQSHTMDDTQILLQLAPCQQSISEECCERVGGNTSVMAGSSLACIFPCPPALLNVCLSKDPSPSPNKHRA